MDLPPDFRDLLEELGRAEAEHVLVGGYAVAFHGRPRATKDIDIVLRGDAENLARAATALTAFGAPTHVVDAIRTMRETDVVYVGEPPLRIDFLRAIEGVDSNALFAHAVSAELDGLVLLVISLEDLIANKRRVGRHRDLDDAAFLERVAQRRTSP